VKILELHLKRYGPFTDVSLDLSKGNHGLHILFGRNEAGKSTTLRALNNLLFGFGHSTRDAFLHEMSQLRIGARLRHSDGEEFAFVRKKGRSKTIVSEDDETPLDEAILNRFLSGVDRGLFSSLYGIGHADLIEGGKAILEERGELGKALYSAALGTAGLRKLLDDLRGTADGLFLPAGKNPVINTLLRNYKDELRTLKEATLNASAWTMLQKDIQSLDSEIEIAEAEFRQTQAEENRLKRVKRILRPLGVLDRVLEELETLGDVIELPEDFGQQRRSAEERLRNGHKEQTKLEIRISTLARQLENLEVDERLSMKAAELHDLSEGLGAYKKAGGDHPAQLAKYRQLAERADDELGSFRPGMSLDEVADLKPRFARRKVIARLAEEDLELGTEEQTTRKLLENLNNKTREIENKLAETPPPILFDGFEARVAATRKAGDVDARIHELRAREQSLAKTCELELKRLGLWSGSPAEFEALSLPLALSVDRIEERFSSNEAEARELARKKSEQCALQDELETRLRELQAGAEVPSPEQLENARNIRTIGWKLVRRAWLDGEDIEAEAGRYDSERPLVQAYEYRVERADSVADRMYQEIERIEQHRSVSLGLAGVGEVLKSIERDLEENRNKKVELDTEWHGFWKEAGISPLSPREMRSWLSDAVALRQKIQDLRTLKYDLRQIEESREIARHALLVELANVDAAIVRTDDGEALAPVLSLAENRLSELRRQREMVRSLHHGRRDAAADLKKARDEAGDLRARRERWQLAWRDAVSWLELGDDPSPAEVSAALEQLASVFELLKEAERQGRRVDGIEKDVRNFEARVAEFSADLEMKVEKLSPAVIVKKMLDDLSRAQKAQERDAMLREQLGSLEAEQEQLIVDIDAAKARLEELKRQAVAKNDDELDQAEAASLRHRELFQQKQSLLQQLQDNGDGLTINRLREEAEGRNIDELPAEIEAGEQRVKKLRSQLDELKSRRAELAAREKENTGEGAAAEAKDRANQILARMRLEVERYLRARTAALMLEEQIDRFRRENQTPLLSRAGQIFSRLSLGAYKGLRDDLDAGGTPIVLGVRPDDKEIPVDGMSDGTCDQLFLSLRLAALERHLEKSEPMPFVVDDILIGFDDERSRAALEVLGELALKTQVILFTHHTRVLELAEEVKSAAGIFVHEMGK